MAVPIKKAFVYQAFRNRDIVVVYGTEQLVFEFDNYWLKMFLPNVFLCRQKIPLSIIIVLVWLLIVKLVDFMYFNSTFISQKLFRLPVNLKIYETSINQNSCVSTNRICYECRHLYRSYKSFVYSVLYTF